jgi:hypothetical protein
MGKGAGGGEGRKLQHADWDLVPRTCPRRLWEMTQQT